MKDAMAVDMTDVGPDRPLVPLADTDDWSFMFRPEVERRLGISIHVEAWGRVRTINDIVEMLNGEKCPSHAKRN